MGYNMFAYCNDNPISLYDDSGSLPKWLKGFEEAADDLLDNLTKCVEKVKKATSDFVSDVVDLAESVASSSNYVTKAHVTTPSEIYASDPFLGTVGFSSTVTQQDKDAGVFYTYTDVGNDSSKSAAGVNIGDWLGLDLGVSSDINAFAGVQFTPWLHCEVSVGIDGICIMVGFDIEDTSFDFEIKGGWGSIAILAFPQSGFAPGVPFLIPVG